MLIFNRKTTDSILFAGITPSNISNDLEQYFREEYIRQIHKFYSDKLM